MNKPEFKIVLIEDDPDDYEAFSRALKDYKSLSIQWIDNGEDVLNQLNDLKSLNLPDIILLDLNLPGIDGRDILKLLQNQNFKKFIPIVILTTSSEYKDIMQSYKYGAHSYIQKPINFLDFKAKLNVLIQYWYNTVILE
jgi:DNA-binding response OmpR family regulator